MALHLRKKENTLLKFLCCGTALIVFCLTPSTMAQSSQALEPSINPAARHLLNFPALLFVVSFFVLCFATKIGTLLVTKRRGLLPDGREDLALISSAALTLLGLLIGFTFSMAISRYDLRKSYEQAEANAIGTEYVQADLLPDADAAKLRTLLKTYLGQRVLFYTASNDEQAKRLSAETARVQTELWSVVERPAAAQPNALTALVVTGINNVLGAEGSTQAAWWNRIPIAAWVLMALIAIVCNVIVGYGMRRPSHEPRLLLILPFIVATSFFLIAEIDSPRGGIIRITPQNLVSLFRSLQSN